MMHDDVEIWYYVEYSNVGADDWFRTTESYDTVDSAERGLLKTRELRSGLQTFEFRIVRKTLTTEVMV